MGEGTPGLGALDGKAAAPEACTVIEEVGSTAVGALTLGFLAMAIAAVFMIMKATSTDAQRKIFYLINAYVCGIAAVSYFAMLSGQGWIVIAGCRQFFYARYLDWALTTPLLLFDLSLLAGVDSVTLASVVGADLFMILGGFMGAVSTLTAVRWFWFLFAMGMYSLVLIAFTGTFREALYCSADPVRERGRLELYGRLAWLTVIMWSFYPLVWLFSEGLDAFSVSFEAVAYTITDLLSKVGFGFLMVQGHEFLLATPPPAEAQGLV